MISRGRASRVRGWEVRKKVLKELRSRGTGHGAWRGTPQRSSYLGPLALGANCTKESHAPFWCPCRTYFLRFFFSLQKQGGVEGLKSLPPKSVFISFIRNRQKPHIIIGGGFLVIRPREGSTLHQDQECRLWPAQAKGGTGGWGDKPP